MYKKIWLSSPHMGENELTYVRDAFTSNWIAPLGPNIEGFETDIERNLGNGIKAVALSSGTAALHLSLILLGIKSGDEVLCQSMTFSATANPIAYQQATPVFVDSELSTWNIDPSLLKIAIQDRITKGKKPKALIVVHLYGMPAQMEEINDIAGSYDIPVIEDAAEALGSKYCNQNAGTFGDIGILSFNGNKIITTSGGGALVSRNKNYVQKAHFLATQARDDAPHYQHSEIGYNYRLSNICAGIGRGQMEVLDHRVKSRRENYIFYKGRLENRSGIVFQDEPNKKYYSNHWLTTILFKDYTTREKVRLHLDKYNIESRPLWKPMHLQPIFSQYPFYGTDVSEKLFEKGLCLPSGSNLSEGDLNFIADRIIEIL